MLQALLLQKFRLCGETSEAILLLETTTAIAEDDLSKVLSFFKKDNDIFIQSIISPTKWSQYWSSVREAMALSISGIHLGHYKV